MKDSRKSNSKYLNLELKCRNRIWNWNIRRVWKKLKRETTEEIELYYQENIRTLEEKENDKEIGISEADTIKQTKMKEK